MEIILEDVLLPIVGMLSAIVLPTVFIGVIILRSLQNKKEERMELLRQGIVPQDVEKRKRIPNSLRSLRNGLLCIGIALGLIVSFVITANTDIDSDMLVRLSCILLFLGIAYVVYYALSRNKLDSENNEG